MVKAILFIVGLSLFYISVHCNEYMNEVSETGDKTIIG